MRFYIVKMRKYLFSTVSYDFYSAVTVMLMSPAFWLAAQSTGCPNFFNFGVSEKVM